MMHHRQRIVPLAKEEEMTYRNNSNHHDGGDNQPSTTTTAATTSKNTSKSGTFSPSIIVATKQQLAEQPCCTTKSINTKSNHAYIRKMVWSSNKLILVGCCCCFCCFILLLQKFSSRSLSTFSVDNYNYNDNNNDNTHAVHNSSLLPAGFFTDDKSPIVFVCCEKLRGTIPNRAQLARTFPVSNNDNYNNNNNTINVDVVIRYLDAPCFSAKEQEEGNPNDKGQPWPTFKQFELERVKLFRRQVEEIHHHGGIILAEGSCIAPPAETFNVWLEALLRYGEKEENNNNNNNDGNNYHDKNSETNSDGVVGILIDESNVAVPAVTPFILNKFLLQYKNHLHRLLVQYGYQDYVPKHYPSIDDINNEEYPVVLKREQENGGAGVYIAQSRLELETHMKEDEQYESFTNIKMLRSKYRTIGTGWVMEEFLPGATQEVIIYIRPRGGGGRGVDDTTSGHHRRQEEAYFWCGSHSNPRWHDDGNFIYGLADRSGKITTPQECNTELLDLMSTVMEKEDIYGTGCINYKYGKDGKPKIHDWNLRTCSTMANWNRGAVMRHIVSQIPRRVGSQKLALFE